MLKSIPFANAMTGVWLTAYVICAALAAIFPNFYLGVASNWIHAIRLSMSNAPVFSFPGFIFGLVTFGVFVWLISYFFVTFYNYLSK